MNRPPAPSPRVHPLGLVTPPYTDVGGQVASPPLGSFFVVELAQRPDLAMVVEAARQAPWVPVVMVQRAGGAPAALDAALQGLRGTPAFVWRRADDAVPMAVLGQDAVRGRPAPDADQVAGWIASRAGRPDLAASLVLALASRPPQGLLARLSPGDRWLARRLRAVSPLTATDWRETFHLATGAGNTRLTTAQAAARLQCDVWTLRRRVERLAGATPEQYRMLAGWEWFVEAVMRKWGIT